MKKRRYVVVLAVLFGATLVAVWLVMFFGAREPSYQGKRLSYWLQGYGDPEQKNPVTREEADAAVRGCGTNAIPALLRMVQTREPAWKVKMRMWWYKKFPPKFTPYGTPVQISPTSLRRSAGGQGFTALGSNALSAEAALLKMYQTDPDWVVRVTAVWALRGIGPAATNARAIFVRDAGNQKTNGIITMELISAIIAMQTPAEFAVPALRRCLNDPWKPAQYDAIKSLEGYGAKAVEVVPVLMRMYAATESDGIVTDGETHSATGSALLAIDPESARKLGIKPEEWR